MVNSMSDTVSIPKKEYLVLKKKAEELDSIKLVSKKLDRIEGKIKTGKRKLLTEEQALGPYTKSVSKKELEKLMKEYYKKYSKLEEKTLKEWEHASKEADAMLDDY